MKTIFRIIYFALFLSPIASMGLPLNGLTDLEGQAAKISHSKNTELVVFWATWCPRCKEKLTGLLPKLNEEKDLAVITINTDKEASRVKHYLEKERVTLPVFWDSSRELRKELKAFSVPHWAVYKRAGVDKPWNLVDSAPAFEWDRVEKALKTAVPVGG